MSNPFIAMIPVLLWGGDAAPLLSALAGQPIRTRKPKGIGAALRLTIELLNYRFWLLLTDTLLQDQMFHEILFEGGFGIIVLDDGSPDAHRAIETSRALAPNPAIVVKTSLQPTELIAEINRFLEVFFDDLYDKNYPDPSSLISIFGREFAAAYVKTYEDEKE